MEEHLKTLADFLDEMEAKRASWTDEDKSVYEEAKKKFQDLELKIKAEKGITVVKEKSKELIDKGKESGLDAVAGVLSEVFDNPNTVDNVDAGIAFAAALIDGWSFGIASSVIGKIAPEMAASLAELRSKNPGASTFGDIAAFVSPQFAAKLWIGGVKLTAKGVAHLIGQTAKHVSPNKADKFLKAFRKSVKFKSGTKIGAKEKDRVIEVFISAAGKNPNIVKLRTVSGRLGNALGKAAKFNKKLDSSLAVLKRQTGLDVADGIQLVIVYNSIYDVMIQAGKSEEDARDIAARAVMYGATGKVLRGAYQSAAINWFKRKPKQLGIIQEFAKKFAIDFGVPVAIFNIGDISDVIDTEVLGVQNKALGGFVSKPKSLIANANIKAKSEMMVKDSKLGNSPMNPLIGSPDTKQMTNLIAKGGY